jgi:hypothetical protein
MREGQLVGATIVAIGIVVAAIVLATVGALLRTADPGQELRLSRAETDIEALRAMLERTEDDIAEAKADTARLREELALMASRAPVPAADSLPTDFTAPGAIDDLPETEALTEEMQLARARYNVGIKQPSNAVMLELLGSPRDSYSTNCQGVTNPRLRALLETRQVGPIRVTMIRPALDSLGRIFAELEESEPDIYAKLGTAGALCVRYVRGSTTSISNHSWGTAIDLKLEGVLDGFGDGSTQFGLLLLAELFNEEGWYWGATYSREDSMHFEVGVETLRRWAEIGAI